MSAPQFEQAAAFLKFLDPAASEFTFQSFDDSPAKRTELVAVFHGTLREDWDELCQLSRAGAGVFVTINETNGRGRTRDDIVRVRALFADLDGAPLQNMWNVPLAPGWVTRTRPGRYHIYWLVKDIELTEFRPLQKRIAELTGSDPAVCDTPRVMRLPGFVHQKGEPVMVKGRARPVERPINERGKVLSILPAIPAPPRIAPPQAACVAGVNAGHNLCKIDGVLAFMANAREGERNRVTYWAACRFNEMVAAGLVTRRYADELLVRGASMAGLTVQEIMATGRSALRARARQ